MIPLDALLPLLPLSLLLAIFFCHRIHRNLDRAEAAAYQRALQAAEEAAKKQNPVH